MTRFLSALSPLKVHDVRSFGAVGDGVTNDTASVQAAINGAQTSGGIVFFPQGTYKVVLPQITTGNIVLRGVGANSKILLADATMASNGQTIGIWVNGATNVIIENLSFDGNFANIAKNGTYATSSPLWTSTVAKYGSASVKNYQYAASGVDTATYLLYRCPIRISDSNNVTVKDCLIQNSISAGILIDGSAVDNSQNIMIRNNRVTMTWDNGIYFHKGIRYGSAIGNHCSDTQYAGITAIYCKDIIVNDNVIHDAGPSASDSAGIEFCAVTGFVAADNEIYNCLFEGIENKDSNETSITNGASGQYVRNYDGTITGNYVHDCNDPRYPSNTASGINVFGATNMHISGNTVERCDYGISVGSKNADIFIESGNTIRSNKSWGIQVGNAPDNFNVQIIGNTIENNGSNGVTSFAPIIFKSNIVRNNAGEGLDTTTVPTGLPYKTDYIEDNIFADNAYNGVHAEGGSTALAVIRNNEFYNSDTLEFYDGVSGTSTTFTSASASFAATDVGASIVIHNSGDSGGSIALSTTIAGYTNSTTVTLATATLNSRTGLNFSLTRGKQVFTDGSMTGTTALTSATAAFTSADVGKTVVFYSGDGPNPSLKGTYTVATYTSPTVVQLNASPENRTGIMFVIKRGLGKQGRAIYMNNNTDVHIIKNRTWCMSTENYPAYNLTNNSQVIDNWDFGSGTSNGNFTPLLQMPVATVNYTRYLGAKDGTSNIDASGGARSVYLPGVSLIPIGSIYTIKKTDLSANAVTVYPSDSATLDGASSYALTLQNQSIIFESNGTNWTALAGNLDVLTKSYVDTGLSTKATDTAVVHLAGTETITGTKRFSTDPIIGTGHSLDLENAAGNSTAYLYNNGATGASIFQTDAPVNFTSTLGVTGKASVGSLRVGTTATAGQVLTADASGNATFQAVTGGSGITRSIQNVSVNTSLGSTASTDYVYVITGSGTYTMTLPTAVSNTNRYTIVNAAPGNQTVASTSSQTINGTVPPISIVPGQSLELIASNGNWYII